jgi:hypothetical protein
LCSFFVKRFADLISIHGNLALSAGKKLSQKAGYVVKGEVGGCDLVGLSDDDPPVIVIGELKLSFNLELILQAVDRANISDEVWIAARISSMRQRS